MAFNETKLRKKHLKYGLDLINPEVSFTQKSMKKLKMINKVPHEYELNINASLKNTKHQLQAFNSKFVFSNQSYVSITNMNHLQ